MPSAESSDPARVTVWRGDITRLAVDAIVNAANAALSGGGGVDGAIHAAAGPELLRACRELGRCPTGEVRMTPGFKLAAPFVIHAVGPVWRGGDMGEPVLLASVYRKSLEVAEQNRFTSIAFPAISTGAYGYPADKAAAVAASAVTEWTLNHAAPTQIMLVAYDERSERMLGSALKHARPTTRADWKLAPSGSMAALPYQREFDAQELAVLRRGLLPRQMEDRWFSYFENGQLFIHRSWTGLGVYRVRFEGRTAVAAFVNDEVDGYQRAPDTVETERLNRIIDVLLRGA